VVPRFSNVIEVSLEEMLESLSCYTEIGMIHMLILSILPSIVHVRSISLSLAVHLKYNVVHVILETCSPIVVFSSGICRTAIEPVYPVLLRLA
jgi:hypothetical protein